MKVTNLLGDAARLDLPSQSVDLIVTHPPYLGTDVERYGGDPSVQVNASQDSKKMLKLLKGISKEFERVLKPNGTLAIANHSIEGFDSRFMTQTLEVTSLKFANYFVQESEDRITIWQHYYKGARPFANYMSSKQSISKVFQSNFNNIDDPIDLQLESESFHVLDVMNKAVPEKFINLFTLPGDIVLDPFGGSGLVAVTAAMLGRTGVTNDISPVQYRAAARRIELSL